MSGEHEHNDVDARLTSLEMQSGTHATMLYDLAARITALETPEPPPPPPPPVVTGEQRLYDTFGFRVSFPIVENAATFIDKLGRVPAYFRWVIDHDSPGMFDHATGSAWQYYPPAPPPTPPTNVVLQTGMAWEWPTMATSTIFPTITGPKGATLTATDRILRHNAVVNGVWDYKITAILDYVDQGPPHTHRFCLASEAELSNWAYRKEGVPPDVWRASFHHVANMIHERGHLVVYAGDGPFLNAGPSGVEWWAYAMPDPDSFDIGPACDVYWGEGINPQTRLNQIAAVQQIATTLGKPVAYPEYGVRANVPDGDKIAWLYDVWDLLATFPTSGPGSLDHHCLWDDDQSKLSADAMAAVVDRFGA